MATTGPTPVMTEVTDLPDAPDAEATDGFGQMLSDLLQHVDPAGRWALLLSRPGAHPTDEADRAWAGALYDVVRSRGIPTTPSTWRRTPRSSPSRSTT